MVATEERVSLDDAFASLASGAVLVTGNRRLARTLRHKFDSLQREQGHTTWSTPAVMPWSAWLDRLWDEYLYSGQIAGAPPIRLGARRERVLWEHCIRECGHAEQLLQTEATAGAAQSAWDLLKSWRLDRAALQALATEDTRVFLQWAARFERTCKARGWIDDSSVADMLCQANIARVLPPRILLAGFDEFTPQQAALLGHCADLGAGVSLISTEHAAPCRRVQRTAFQDSEEEILAAARWARRTLESLPDSQIGIVFPDLPAVRSTVERTFRRVLFPAPADADRSRNVFNISAAPPLSTYPLIGAALLLLELDPGENPVQVITEGLLSPFIPGWSTEWAARAALDKTLRGQGNATVSWGRVLETARDTGCLARLCGVISQWAEARRAAPERQAPSRWSDAFSSLLRTWGWPGDRTSTSDEHQQLEAWAGVLAEFAAMDLVLPELTFAEALRRVQRIASETVHQPESENAPIQILGMLEASGLQFDHLWIAGLDDERWPAAAAPHPFLPAAVQRERGLPHSSPERELAYARRLTARLLACAPDTMVSHALRDGDRALGPSTLITHIAPCELPGESSLDFASVIFRSGATEIQLDDSAPQVSGDSWQRGGAKVFQYQAACPFRAFAELRLAAGQIENPEPGLDARTRGILVHSAMERVWAELKSQERLLQLSQPEVAGLVTRAVDEALASLESRRGELSARYAALEKARLQRLLLNWLELEKQRDPFIVLEPERERYIEIGGVRCLVKPDRVDRLPGGEHVMIDYKTGEPAVRAWFGDRPDEPQLPVYSATYGGRLGGVLFAQLKPGKLAFKGITSAHVHVPGAKQDHLEDQIDGWRQVLERLGADFRAGVATVDPKKPAQSCRNCELAPLCRVSEADIAYQEDGFEDRA